MNVRVGNAALYAGLLVASLVVGCKGNATPGPTPTPTPIGSASISPDTLWVQDATSRTVRSYKGASTLNGGAIASVVLLTNDTFNPDVVYDPTTDTLWYPNQTNPQPTPAAPPVQMQINIWTVATTRNNMSATFTVQTANTLDLEGAAVFDSAHNLLIVAHNTNNTVDIYASATTMTTGALPSGHVTLTMTDPLAPGTARPQEMLYDPVGDRLFVSDNGAVCAKFNGFGAAAAALSGGTTIAMSSSTQISGLLLGGNTGLAYNSALDILFVTEKASTSGQIDVIPNASTSNTFTSHGQTITNFVAPTGLAYDAVRDILFIYDSGGIVVLPNGTTASGNENVWPNRRGIFDLTTALSGFGLFVDTTR